MATRLSALLATGSTTLPIARTTNHFPHTVLVAFGSAWISSTGYDHPAYLAGQPWAKTAKIERRALSDYCATLEASITLGAYESPIGSGNYTHGGSDLIDYGGFVWALDFGTLGGLVKIDPANNAIAYKVIMPGGAYRGITKFDNKLFVTDGIGHKLHVVDPALVVASNWTGSAWITNPVIASVTLGANKPFRLDTSGGKVYVPCHDSNVVKVVDGSAPYSVLDTVPTTSGLNPCGVYRDPATGIVHILNYGQFGIPGGDTITLIDPATDTVIDTWPVAQNGGLHQMRRMGNELVVSLSAIHKLWFLNASTGAFIRERPTRLDPAFFDVDGSCVICPCALENALEITTVLDTYN